MSSSSFGTLFRVTTFGESHGPAIGAVLDGVPPGLPLTESEIQADLDRRRPGRDPTQSPRKELDRVEIVSGVHEGKTTGAPIGLLIRNHDARPRDYDPLKQVYRPGHADFTMQQKYGIRDARGGGRSSGRETASRVAAAAVARQLLRQHGIRVVAGVAMVAGVEAELTFDGMLSAREDPLRCPDAEASVKIRAAIEAAMADNDSVGGIVECRARGVPVGLGEPVFGKLDARLAGALMSIGAVKGVEVGAGFSVATKRGSEVNDSMMPGFTFASNNAGGILGGISNGDEIVVRVAVKPPSSIAQEQQTVDSGGNPATVSVTGRHDPCIVPRVVAVVEAMVCLVLADLLMMHKAKQAPP